MSQLAWSHYLELIKIKEQDKRNFYQRECINSKWDVRELQRQIASLLYERLIIPKDKEKIHELSIDGIQIIYKKGITLNERVQYSNISNSTEKNIS